MWIFTVFLTLITKKSLTARTCRIPTPPPHPTPSPGAFLCGVCMFSPCLRGFCLATLTSSHGPKTCHLRRVWVLTLLANMRDPVKGRVVSLIDFSTVGNRSRTLRSTLCAQSYEEIHNCEETLGWGGQRRKRTWVKDNPPHNHPWWFTFTVNVRSSPLCSPPVPMLPWHRLQNHPRLLRNQWGDGRLETLCSE